jgi:outer membrane biosynthesis protein TonB
MPLGLGPRFIVEAAFLVAVAVAAAMLSLTTPAIVAVMGGAWLLVAAIEWGLSRRAAAAVARGSARIAAPEREPAHRRRVAVPEPVVESDPLPEPILPEPVAVSAVAEPSEDAEATPPPLTEPVPPVAAERVELVAVPEPEPEPEPEREPEPEPEPEPEVGRAPVVHLDPLAREPREWNLWDLERAARETAGEDAERDEERSFLLMYLRDFAGPDGSLPTSFDALVRDSFGDLIGSLAR